MQDVKNRWAVVQCDNCKTEFKLNEEVIKVGEIDPETTIQETYIECPGCKGRFVYTRTNEKARGLYNAILAETDHAKKLFLQESFVKEMEKLIGKSKGELAKKYNRKARRAMKQKGFKK